MRAIYKESVSICDICDRKFSGKNEKMVVKWMFLHLKQTHNETSYKKCSFNNIHDEQLFKSLSHDETQVKINYCLEILN